MTTPADQQILAPAAPGALSSHMHGSLDAITDSERRALRSIGMTAYEVAAKTGALLADLLKLPGIWIFQGVRPTSADLPRIPHAISVGRWLVFVESVAWPPGRYAATPDGQINCDGVYIGQSVRPLMAAVRHWREFLPPGHRVNGLVIVHPTADGDLCLPAMPACDLALAHASDAVSDIRSRLPRDRQAVSMRMVAALEAATAKEENR